MHRFISFLILYLLLALSEDPSGYRLCGALVGSETPSEDRLALSAEALDFTHAFKHLNQYNLDEDSHNEGYLLGHAIGSHYKKEPLFCLPKLIDALQKLRLSENSPSEGWLSDRDQDLINRLHWNIYS